MKLLVITQKIDEEDDVLGFFVYWVRALAKRAERVDVICLAKGKFDLPKNVRVFSLGKEKGRSKFVRGMFFYLYLLYLLPVADGFFAHMAPEYVKAAYPVNLIFRKPTVMWYAHIKVSPAAKWAINHVDYVLTPSKESFELDSPKVVSTGHGINTELFHLTQLPPQAEVLTISRISKVKRIETLIEAARILKEKGRTFSVSIYGEPARMEDWHYEEELKGLVDRYDLKNVIIWQGSIPNKETPRIYGSHRVFVRLQGGGGFGKTELESMACGTPAIVPTEVYLGEFGAYSRDLYFREDDASGLAFKIEQVLAWDEEQRRAYAQLAHRFVEEKHNVENVAAAIIKYLSKKS